MSVRLDRPLLPVVVVVSLLATPALAGFAGTDLYVPMAGRQAGVYPSNWYTTIWVHNPGSQAATARIYFLERGTANPSPPYVDVLVAAGDTEKIVNVVESLFQKQTYGALRVTCATQKLVVTSRVYSKLAGGDDTDSLGQDFAGVPASFAVGLGETTQILGVHQTQPSGDSEFRYNFGAVETTGHSVTVRFTAYDDNGADLGHTDLQVREYSQRQVAFKDHFPSVSEENARLQAEVISGSGKVIAYGSAIANGSQDPTTFEMTYADTLLAGGLTSVQHDATLVGDGSAGAPLGLADAAVTGVKIAPAAVSADKIDTTGATSGQVLKVGSPAHWADDGLTLPFAGNAISSFAALLIQNSDISTNSVGILGRGQFGVQGEGNAGFAGVVGLISGESNQGFLPAGVAGTAGPGTAVSGMAISGTGVYGRSTSGDGVYGYSSTGAAVRAQSVGSGPGVYASSAQGPGVQAYGGTLSDGVRGESSINTKSGVYGVNSNAGGYGVFGRNTATLTTGYLGGAAGVAGIATSGTGVYGESTAGGWGVHGKSDVFDGYLGYNGSGVLGGNGTNYGYLGRGSYGVQGEAVSPGGIGVFGHSSNGEGVNGSSGGLYAGVHGFSAERAGVWGESTSDAGVYGTSSTGWAGYFNGKLRNSNLAGSGNRAVYSDSTGVLTNSSSDGRLKRDVVPLAEETDVLGALAELRAVAFNWDTSLARASDLGDQREIGMIAQEVEPVLPYLVRDNADGFKSLDYAKLTAFLIEVAKAQQREIAELRAEVASVRNGLP